MKMLALNVDCLRLTRSVMSKLFHDPRPLSVFVLSRFHKENGSSGGRAVRSSLELILVVLHHCKLSQSTSIIFVSCTYLHL